MGMEWQGDVRVGVSCQHLSNVLDRDARERGVDAGDGVARGLGEAGAREAARDVELLRDGRLVVRHAGEVERLGHAVVVAGGDLEHGGQRQR